MKNCLYEEKNIASYIEYNEVDNLSCYSANNVTDQYYCRVIN